MSLSRVIPKDKQRPIEQRDHPLSASSPLSPESKGRLLRIPMPTSDASYTHSELAGSLSPRKVIPMGISKGDSTLSFKFLRLTRKEKVEAQSDEDMLLSSSPTCSSSGSWTSSSSDSMATSPTISPRDPDCSSKESPRHSPRESPRGTVVSELADYSPPPVPRIPLHLMSPLDESKEQQSPAGSTPRSGKKKGSIIFGRQTSFSSLFRLSPRTHAVPEARSLDAISSTSSPRSGSIFSDSVAVAEFARLVNHGTYKLLHKYRSKRRLTKTPDETLAAIIRRMRTLSDHLKIWTSIGFTKDFLDQYHTSLGTIRKRLLRSYRENPSKREEIKIYFSELKSCSPCLKDFISFYDHTESLQPIINSVFSYMLGKKYPEFISLLKAYTNINPQISKTVQWDPSQVLIQETGVPFWVRPRTDRHNIDDPSKENLFEFDLNLITEEKMRRSLNVAGKLQIFVRQALDPKLQLLLEFFPNKMDKQSCFQEISEKIHQGIENTINFASLHASQQPQSSMELEHEENIYAPEELVNCYTTSILKIMNIEAFRIADLLFRRDFGDLYVHFGLAADPERNIEYKIILNGPDQFEVFATKSFLIHPCFEAGKQILDRNQLAATINYTLRLAVNPIKNGVGVEIVNGDFKVTGFRFETTDGKMLAMLFHCFAKDVAIRYS